MPRLEPSDETAARTYPTLGQELAKRVSQSYGVSQWPPPRPTWRDEIVQSYDAFQRDVSASAARDIDLATILRFFDVNELIARLYDELLEQVSLAIETNSGANQTHPHIAAIARLTSISIKLANEIGATPMSRLKLGLTKVEGQKALQELERRIGGEVDRIVKLPEDQVDDVLDGEVVEEF